MAPTSLKYLLSSFSGIQLPFTSRHQPDTYAPLSENGDEDDGQDYERQNLERRQGKPGWKSPSKLVDSLLLLVLFAITILLVIILVVMGHRFTPLSAPPSHPPPLRPSPPNTPPASPGKPEPAELNMMDPTTFARWTLDNLRQRQSTTLFQASARYRLKTNRPPPPNFDKWFNFARERSCLIDDYDQIHRDVKPLYQLAEKDPEFFKMMLEKGMKQVREQGVGMKTSVVRDGVYRETDDKNTAFNGDWKVTIGRFSKLLPDMDMILNGRDEPRVLFDHRQLDMMDRALNPSDSTPFHHTPSPTSIVFTDQKMCLVSNDPSGFNYLANGASGFLIDSTSTDFTTDYYPVLSMTKITPCYSDVLVPSEYYYSHSGWSPKYSHPNNVAWDDKKPQLYWRGHATGGHINGTNYHQFPRFKAVDIGMNHTDIMDVRITALESEHCNALCSKPDIEKAYGMTGNNEPRENVYKYKYVFDVDGNTFSSRYLGLLRSGSLVFKATIFSEYFNDWLKPYESYIPVLPDLSDLVEKVQWAISNDAEAHRIQETGRLFAQELMNDNQNDCYFFLVLLEWARLQEQSTAKKPT
ncbi:glycosyl transferase family 90-domain-containing protein [Mycena floridula]|nr:glycosyl transferase family 90-domain-containing protein [Mycena floridula]